MSKKGVDDETMEQRREALEAVVEYHGHVCMGQLLGVHIAHRGMDEIGTADPKEMIVFVENDRCIADAIQILTGTRLGRRTMKLVNYGKMAATFYNTETEKAVRVSVSQGLNDIVGKISEDREEKQRQFDSILEAPSDDVVDVRPVTVEILPKDMPGRPKRTVMCSRCGEKVMDGKDFESSDGPQCYSCHYGAYYVE